MGVPVVRAAAFFADQHRLPPPAAGGLATFGHPHYEESLVYQDGQMFTDELVDPAIAGLMHRFERRLDLRITIGVQIPVFDFRRMRFAYDVLSWSISQVLWRRLYDLLSGPGAVGLGSALELDVTASPDPVAAGTVSGPPTDPIENALASPDRASACRYAYRYVMP